MRVKGIARKIKGKVGSIINRNENLLVNFIICGAQKGGTSALDGYLREHPSICMADQKEVHFFDNDAMFQKNTVDYAQYHSFYKPQPTHKLVGEATPVYMYWHDAAKRMWQYNPELKLLIVLRNPIDRAYSHWNMQRTRKKDSLLFWDAIHQEAKRCKKNLPYQHRLYSYIDRGFYSEQLRRLFRFFPKENILILKNEYLRDEPEKCLQQVCEFLEVEHYESVSHKEIHSRPYTSQMSEKEREYLRSVYEFDIRQVERMLDWDCSSWLA